MEWFDGQNISIEDKLKILQIIEAYLKKEGSQVFTATDSLFGLE